jgi:Ala-tRNA(Pro) deacylase
MYVEQFLKNRGVWHEVVRHRIAFSAGTAARSMHVPVSFIAKSVLLFAGERPLLAVLPGDQMVDLSAVAKCLGRDDVRVATEGELPSWFTDCELGALPPFGSHYGCETIVDESLADQSEILIESNRTDEAILLRFEDYRWLEAPLMAAIARQAHLVAHT